MRLGCGGLSLVLFCRVFLDRRNDQGSSHPAASACIMGVDGFKKAKVAKGEEYCAEKFCGDVSLCGRNDGLFCQRCWFFPNGQTVGSLRKVSSVSLVISASSSDLRVRFRRDRPLCPPCCSPGTRKPTPLLNASSLQKINEYSGVAMGCQAGNQKGCANRRDGSVHACWCSLATAASPASVICPFLFPTAR